MKRFFFFFLINVACCSSMVKAFDYINYKGLVLSAHDNHLAIRGLDTAYFHRNGIDSFDMPDYVEYDGKKMPITHVFSIPPCSRLKKITLPSYVKVIHTGAFRRCTNLREIVIPQSVEEILQEAFIGCKNLERIEIPKSVKVIRSHTFDGCSSLKEVIFKGKVKNIEPHAFMGCSSLTQFRIPEGVRDFSVLSIYECDNIETIYIPKTLDSFRVHRLKSLAHIVVDRKNKSFQSIDDVLYTRNREGLVLYPERATRKSYKIDDSVKTIGRYAFRGSSLDSIMLPDNLEMIEEWAFEQCGNLRYVKYPSHDFTIFFSGLVHPISTKVSRDLLESPNAADLIMNVRKCVGEYYEKTVQLIFSSLHQGNAHSAEDIAARVYRILYGLDDKIITKELKLDLLHRMMLFGGEATKEYKRILLSSFSKIEYPEYCIPIMCNVSELKSIDLNAFEKDLGKHVPSSYIPYYQKYINLVKDELAEYEVEKTVEYDNPNAAVEEERLKWIARAEKEGFCNEEVLVHREDGKGAEIRSRDNIMKSVAKERNLNQWKDLEIDLENVHFFMPPH